MIDKLYTLLGKAIVKNNIAKEEDKEKTRMEIAHFSARIVNCIKEQALKEEQAEIYRLKFLVKPAQLELEFPKY